MALRAWLAGLVAASPAAVAPFVNGAGTVASAPYGLWDRALPGPPVAAATHTERGRAAMDAGSVYVGSAGTNGLHQFSRATGALVRVLSTQAPVQAEPLLVDEGGASLLLFSDTSGATRLWPALAEAPRWVHEGGAPITARPVLADGQVLVATVDDALYALDAANGSLKWRYQRPADPSRASELTLYGAPSPVVLPDGTVLAGFSDGALVVLSAGGEVQWERRVGEGRYPDLIATPAVADGVAYAAGFSEPLVALDLGSRAVRWRLEVGSASAPVIDGATLYVGGSDGTLYAVDRFSGVIDWQWESGTPGALTEPVLVEAGLLVGSSDGSLYLVDRAGELLWRWDPELIPPGFTATPAVSGRQVVATTNAGRLMSWLAPRP